MLSIRSAALLSSLIALGSLANAQANLPPVVSTGGNSGVDYRVDCNNVFNGPSAVTSVQLDGSGSFDPNGTPVTFVWHNECAFGSFDDPTSPTPVYHVDMTGACTRDCWIALRVSSGGQTTIKGFQVIVQDATAPLLTLPADVVGILGDSLLPADTGAATAVDNCDPAPFISFTDTNVPQTGPGQPEVILQRAWTVTDCNGLQTTGVQSIILIATTGQGSNRANLDFDPFQCPNLFDPVPATGTIDVVLLGAASFKAQNVDKASLRLSLRTVPNVSIAPATVPQLVDTGSITATNYGECNALTLDGRKDLRMRFTRTALSAQLGLMQLAPGQTVEVVITGRMRPDKGGKLFATRDTITIQ